MQRVIWRKGGLRRSCGPWDPSAGKTGFYPAGLYYLHRLIEEPNPFSIITRRLMRGTTLAKVDGFEYGISSYEDMIDHLLDRGSLQDVVRVEIGAEWFLLQPGPPFRRMTPHETWLVDSSVLSLATRSVDDA